MTRAYRSHKIPELSAHGRRIIIERLKDGDPIAVIARGIGQSEEVVRRVGREAGVLKPAKAKEADDE